MQEIAMFTSTMAVSMAILAGYYARLYWVTAKERDDLVDYIDRITNGGQDM